MIYKYTISAFGSVEDKKIIEALTDLGIQVEFIEKIPDIPSLIAEQPTDEELELIEKWMSICERKLSNRTDMQAPVAELLRKADCLSKRALAEAIYQIGTDLDLSNGTMVKIIFKVMENL